MKVEVTVRTRFIGSEDSITFDIDDDATEQEIEETAKDYMFDMIEWGWKKK